MSPADVDMPMPLFRRPSVQWSLVAFGALAAIASALWQVSDGDASAAIGAAAPDGAPATSLPATGVQASVAPSTPASPFTPAPQATAPPALVPAITLVGISVAGSVRAAWVRNGTDTQLQQLRVGDPLGSLVVAAIEPERIVLARRDQGSGAAAVVNINMASPTAATPAAAPAASRPTIPPSNVPPGVHYFEPEVVVEGH